MGEDDFFLLGFPWQQNQLGMIKKSPVLVAAARAAAAAAAPEGSFGTQNWAIKTPLKRLMFFFIPDGKH